MLEPSTQTCHSDEGGIANKQLKITIKYSNVSLNFACADKGSIGNFSIPSLQVRSVSRSLLHDITQKTALFSQNGIHFGLKLNKIGCVLP